MNLKRTVMMAVLALAIAAVAVPLVGLRARAASGTAGSGAMASSKAIAAEVATAMPSAAVTATVPQREVAGGPLRADVRESVFGRTRKDVDLRSLNERIANRIKGGGGSDAITTQAGEPATIMNSQSALSAALITTIGGRDNQFSEVALLADWDGR
jgi:hypothetical protein